MPAALRASRQPERVEPERAHLVFDPPGEFGHLVVDRRSLGRPHQIERLRRLLRLGADLRQPFNGARLEPAIGVAYMAAKAGAAHLVRNVALEMAAYNITVNAIAPGMFVTNIGGGHFKDEAVQAEMGKAIPAHRVGFPSDMYGLALFLASPASAYVTGQEIFIDGGLSLGQAD